MASGAARLLTVLVLASAVVSALAEVPEVLIIQRRVEKSRDVDPNQEIGDYVAQELQDGGRVSPIYWSMTDAIFRTMVQTHKVTNTDAPSVLEAQQVAKNLKFAYVLMVEAHTDRNGVVLVRAELYKGDTMVWVDPSDAQNLNANLGDRLVKKGLLSRLDADRLNEAHGFRNFSVSGTGNDMANTMRSVAHTWSELLAGGPFSSIPARPQAPNPEAIPGPIAKLTSTAPQAPRHADNAQVFKDVEASLREGHKEAAIMILREAVDAEPFDLPRREALIKLLNDTGRPELAASEAARAAALNPTSGGLRLDGARSHLASGNLDAAQAVAKDAIAHDAKNADAHLVLGEVRLLKLDLPTALAELNTAVELSATTEAVFYRGVTRALLGDITGAAADCESAHHGSVVQPTPPYATTVGIFDAGAQQVFDGVRDLLPSVSIGKNSADITTTLTRTQNAATAVSSFIATWDVPKEHDQSHQHRLLALKMLAQACGELAAYIAKRDDETLTDARIDLGEAMKQFKLAKQMFTAEAAP